MLKDLFERLREGDKINRDGCKDVFTVTGSYSDGSKIVAVKHVQLPGDDIKEWRHADNSPIIEIQSLQLGDIVKCDSSDIEYTIATISGDHAYGVCILEIQSSDAEQWRLIAQVQLKIV